MITALLRVFVIIIWWLNSNLLIYHTSNNTYSANQNKSRIFKIFMIKLRHNQVLPCSLYCWAGGGGASAVLYASLLMTVLLTPVLSGAPFFLTSELVLSRSLSALAIALSLSSSSTELRFFITSSKIDHRNLVNEYPELWMVQGQANTW